MKKDFLTIQDLRSKEIKRIIDKAFEYKNVTNSGAGKLLGKIVVLVFEHASLRTRAAFELSAKSLGAKTLFFRAVRFFVVTIPTSRENPQRILQKI